MYSDLRTGEYTVKGILRFNGITEYWLYSINEKTTYIFKDSRKLLHNINVFTNTRIFIKVGEMTGNIIKIDILFNGIQNNI